MILLNWNIEHMNSWWTGSSASPPNQLRDSFDGSRIAPAIVNVPDLARRVGNVINAINPDVVAIQEGAGQPEMTQFFDEFVDHDWTFFRGGSAQSLVLAGRFDGDVSEMSIGGGEIGGVDLETPFDADVNADLDLEELKFARKPLVVNLVAHGHPITVINNHLKSKFVQGAEQMWNNGGADRREFIRRGLIVRRRISAEAFRIRAYLDALFESDADSAIVLAGDLNDGPGADFFESEYLTHSVVDRVFGSIFEHDRQLVHVLLNGGSTDYTAQFHDFIVDELKDLVIDHVGISRPIDKNWTWSGRVAVTEYEAQIVPNDGTLKERDLMPSDHRPVVLEMTPN